MEVKQPTARIASHLRCWVDEMTPESEEGRQADKKNASPTQSPTILKFLPGEVQCTAEDLVPRCRVVLQPVLCAVLDVGQKRRQRAPAEPVDPPVPVMGGPSLLRFSLQLEKRQVREEKGGITPARRVVLPVHAVLRRRTAIPSTAA